MASLSAQALPIMSDYTMQELSNSAWACATLGGDHLPLMSAVGTQEDQVLQSTLQRAV